MPETALGNADSRLSDGDDQHETATRDAPADHASQHGVDGATRQPSERLIRDDRPADSSGPGSPAKKSKKSKAKKHKSAAVVTESDDDEIAVEPANPPDEPSGPRPQQEQEQQQEQESVAPPDKERKKKKKKKKHRHASRDNDAQQEEEWPAAAQALLGLSKGVVGSGDGEGTEQPAADEGEKDATKPIASAEAGLQNDGNGGKKKKRKSKKVQDAATSAAVDDNGASQHLPEQLPDANTDTLMADAPPVSTHEQQYPPQPEPGYEDAIISQHLATHMSKTAPPPPPPAEQEEMHIEQRLANGLQQNGYGSQVQLPQFPSNQPVQVELAPPAKKSRTKRKRAAAAVAENDAAHDSNNGLVDPQLMQLDASASNAGEASPAKRRRATFGNIEQMVVENLDQDQANNPSFKRPRGRPKKPASNLGLDPADAPVDDTPNGTFSVEERFEIDKALQKYREGNEMTEEDLRQRIWGNQRRKDDFWNEICRAVPERSRASVYKHVRRTYHVFEMRAKWTDEDDEMLATLVREKGNKWKDIGEAMGRMGEDCRDRYRNYVKCGKDRGTDRWSEEEEALLKKTVAECKERVAKALQESGKPVPEDEDQLINWTTVSDIMENVRSRIQCRYKWRKMQAQQVKVNRVSAGMAYTGGKKKRMAYDVKQMLPGDKMWLLTQIRDSGAQQENQIPWDWIAKNDKDIGVWTHKDLKTAYKSFRSHIPHRRRPLSEILKQLFAEEAAKPGDKTTRFQPDVSAQPDQQPDGTPEGAPQAPVPPFSNYAANSSGVDLAPVANMDASFPDASHNAREVTPKPESQGIAVDPSLMDVGVGPSTAEGDLRELERTAGEAMSIAAAALQDDGTADGSERQLMMQLSKFNSSAAASS